MDNEAPARARGQVKRQVKEWLRKNPSASYLWFVQEADLKCSDSYYDRLRRQVQRELSGDVPGIPSLAQPKIDWIPVSYKKGSKNEQIVEWIRSHPSVTYSVFLKESGIKTSQTSFSRFRKFVERERQGLSGEGPVKSQKGPTKEITRLQDQVEALLVENKYLRWYLEGERLGFLDRLLDEMTQGKPGDKV